MSVQAVESLTLDPSLSQTRGLEQRRTFCADDLEKPWSSMAFLPDGLTFTTRELHRRLYDYHITRVSFAL